MSPALWGMLTALGWGGADFIARFTGRAAGYQVALLGMLGVSAALLARLVLREAISPLRWAGVGSILAGVAALSA